MHDLNIERLDKNPHFTVCRIYIRAVYQPFKIIGQNSHLIMYAFEDDGSHTAFDNTDFRFHQFYIFRTDDYVYRVISSEALIYT